MPRGMSEDDWRPVVYRRGRTVYFFDEITNMSVCAAIKFIQDLETENSKKPIELIIDSEGGFCYDGLALYDKLRNSPCEIITIGTGLIASMAVTLYLAGDKRYITESASIMIHQGMAELKGSAYEIQAESQELKRLEDISDGLIAERTGQSIKKLRNDIKSGPKYLSAEQAIIEGYADEIILNKRTRKRRKKKLK